MDQPKDWSEFARCRRCKDYIYKQNLCGYRRDKVVTPDSHCAMFEAATPDKQQTIAEYITKQQKEAEQKKNKNSDDDHEHCSFYVDDTMICQQIYDTNKGTSAFLIYDGQTIKKTTKFTDKAGMEYRPITGEELQLKVVQLPTGTDDYGSIAELVAEIKAHLHKYLDISQKYEQFAAWYVLLTWVYDRFNTILYLRCLGDTGTGKTRFLNVIGGLCFNATKASGAVTVAVMKRITKKWRGTIIVDEGDFKDSDEKNELIKFFNLGFEKDSPMMNCNKDDPNLLEFYIPFCPKIISTRKSFDDKALEARCLTEVMQQTSRADLPYILPINFHTEQQILRNKLLKFRFDNFRKINTSDENMKYLATYQIEARLKQATYAFSSLFAHDEAEREQFRYYIEEYQKDLIQERQESFDGQVVGAIYKLISSNTKDFDTQDIINVGNLTDYKGNPLKPRALTKTLKSLGLHKTIVKKVDGESKRIIIIDMIIFTEILKRYGYEVTKVTMVTDTCENQNMPKCAEVLSKSGGGYGLGGAPRSIVTSVTSVTNNQKYNTQIYHKCYICGLEPCDNWSRTGKALCEFCFKDYGEI